MKLAQKTFVHFGFFAAAILVGLTSTSLARPVNAQGNPMSRRIELGKQLFFEPRLSSDGTISCNSCHNVMLDGTDARPTSAGVRGQRGGRNAPTVWNALDYSVMFWDGRAATLEDQAKGPITNPIEMGMNDHAAAIDRLNRIPGYAPLFESAFGSKGVTIERVATAIADFERTLIAKDSPYDQFLKGNKKALSASAQRGHQLVASTGCLSCHSGSDFMGPPLPKGTGFFMKFPTFPGSEYDAKFELSKDLGRFQATNKPEDKNMWRVQSLRNVALTAPYFHNGKVATLDEAVRVMARTQLNKTLAESEVADIVEFLKSLTGKFPALAMPRLPETSGQSLIVSD